MPQKLRSASSRTAVTSDSDEKLIRVRIRSLDIPPIKDGLLIGKDAAIGGEAIARTLRLMTHEKFERILLQDGIIQEVIVRTAVLRKVGRDRMLAFIQRRIRPVMTSTELLLLDIDVELVIEDVI